MEGVQWGWNDFEILSNPKQSVTPFCSPWAEGSLGDPSLPLSELRTPRKCCVSCISKKNLQNPLWCPRSSKAAAPELCLSSSLEKIPCDLWGWELQSFGSGEAEKATVMSALTATLQGPLWRFGDPWLAAAPSLTLPKSPLSLSPQPHRLGWDFFLSRELWLCSSSALPLLSTMEGLEGLDGLEGLTWALG